ncbi:hypothetical protein NH340_JMT01090 [Sarcoptes scabiei]|nr:hypothetical protein NH340_JMT01090 [Sarcoptes scabiei]
MNEDNTFKRGNVSWIFGNNDSFMSVDHIEKNIKKTNGKLNLTSLKYYFEDDKMENIESKIADRLAMPITTTYLDPDKINFERAKSGLIGFRTDRTEKLNGYKCKVYSAQNIEFVHKTRTEHLTQIDKNDRYDKRFKETSTLTRTILGVTEQNISNPFADQIIEDQFRRNPYQLTMREYFNLSASDRRDIGGPREINIKKKFFNATVWMCEEFPISLKEQILPIVDIMAAYSSHFEKLQEFINLKLPQGFPIQIEIPLFYLLNAKIGFGNVNGSQVPVDGVRSTPSNDSIENTNLTQKCIIDASCFEPPSGYEIIEIDSPFDSEDANLQFTLNISTANNQKDQLNIDRKSMQNEFSNEKDQNAVLKTSNLEYLGDEQLSFKEILNYDSEKDLQKAIQLSLKDSAIEKSRTKSTDYILDKAEKRNDSKASNDDDDSSSSSNYESCDEIETNHSKNQNFSTNTAVDRKLIDEDEINLHLALEQSKQDHSEQLRQELEEEKIFDRILKLSLIEK